MNIRNGRHSAARSNIGAELDAIGQDVIERRIKRAFPIGPDLDERTGGRIMAKIERGRLERSSLRKSVIRSFLQPRKLLVAGGLTTVLLVAILLIEGIRIPSRGPIVERALSAAVITKRALAAVEQPGKITYYKITGITTPADSKDPSKWQQEYWIDFEHKMKKFVWGNDYPGEALDTRAILIKDGKTITWLRSPNLDGVVTESESSPAEFNDPLEDDGLRYREMLRKGEAKLLGEETVDGIATFKIKVELDWPDKFRHIGILNIRKDDYHPVRSVSEEWNKGKLLRSSTAKYEVQLLDQKLGEKIFTLEIPESANRHVTRDGIYMFNAERYKAAQKAKGDTLGFDINYIKEIKNFKEFDVYYLGDYFEGLKFEGKFSYRYDKAVSGPDASMAKPFPDAQIDQSYLSNERQANGTYIDSIDLTIWPKFNSAVDRSSLQGVKSELEVDGKTIFIKESPVYCQVFVDMGNSTIMIGGTDRERLIRAVRALVKVN